MFDLREILSLNSFDYKMMPTETNIPTIVKRVLNVKITRLQPGMLKFTPRILKTVGEEIEIPKKVDLRPKMPPVYDQGTLGSCSANALGACYEYEDERDDLESFRPSRLFLYYNERKMEGNITVDSGATMASGIQSLQDNGVCDEKIWAYDITKFAREPPVEAYSDALKHRAVVVSNIPQNERALKRSLATGYPFVVGILVFSSMMTYEVARTGYVPLPDLKTDDVQGGHAIMIVGYDDSQAVWICRNSWGREWGDKGYFYLPYAYLLDSNLSSDVWNISKVTESDTLPDTDETRILKEILDSLETIKSQVLSLLHTPTLTTDPAVSYTTA